jgi:vesicle coat complex subunit
MDFLGDSNNPSALDVVAFVREVVEKFPHLRETICARLMDTLPEIKSSKVFRGVLWILGEYVEGVAAVEDVFKAVRKIIGEIPILAGEQKAAEDADGVDGADDGDKKEKDGGRPKVLADGTYATETAFSIPKSSGKSASKPPLRSMSQATFYLARLAHIWLHQHLSLAEISSLLPSWRVRWRNSSCDSRACRKIGRNQMVYERRCVVYVASGCVPLSR